MSMEGGRMIDIFRFPEKFKVVSFNV